MEPRRDHAIGMEPAAVRPGVRVDYHGVITRPPTITDTMVTSEPWTLGDGTWVVKIQGKTGGVALHALSPTPACRVCGCTERHACEGGCGWVEEDLCSRCAGRL